MSKTETKTIEVSLRKTLEPVSVNINHINNITEKKTTLWQDLDENKKNKENLNSKEYLGTKGLTLIQFNNNLVSNNLDQENKELNQSKGLSSMGDGGIMGITQVLNNENYLKDPKQTKGSLQCKLPLEGDVVSMEASRNDSEY